MILVREPETYIGSLKEVATDLGVGIVTVQQAARILEHEGLLAVRRGPGGGYYGKRPDEASLDRALAAYLQVHGFGASEAVEMIALLDCEMMPAAARSADASFHASLREIAAGIESCETMQQRVALEANFRNVLFKAVVRPLAELIYRITSVQFRAHPQTSMNQSRPAIAFWKDSRLRIINAILARDVELARFEAERFRREVLVVLRGTQPALKAAKLQKQRPE